MITRYDVLFFTRVWVPSFDPSLAHHLVAFIFRTGNENVPKEGTKIRCC
jgi:hypothetical protein